MFFPRIFLLYLLLSFAPVKMKNIRTIPRSKELSMNGMRILKKDLIQLKHKASWFFPTLARLQLRFFFFNFPPKCKKKLKLVKEEYQKLDFIFQFWCQVFKGACLTIFFLFVLVETKFRSYNLNFLFLFRRELQLWKF